MEKAKYPIGLLRISLGWLLFWAFLDKSFGLGISTSPESAWFAGGSPTSGFLGGADGYFSFIFQPLAGSGLVDFLFMAGLFLVGIALILGIGMKVASASGSVMFFLMWLAELPLAHNPIIDKHIIYILILLSFVYISAGDFLGLGKKWKSVGFVKKYPILE